MSFFMSPGLAVAAGATIRPELINQRGRGPVQIVRWMIPAILINETHHLFDSRSLGNVAWFG